MNEDQLRKSPLHNDTNDFFCNLDTDSNASQPGKIKTPNIESVFQSDLSFSSDNTLFGDSVLNFEKWVKIPLKL